MGKEFRLSTIEMPLLNIFEIQNPENWFCKILKYAEGHSILPVRLRPQDDLTNDNDIFLVFDSVEYFEGPFSWRGANFCVSTFDELVALFSRIDNLNMGRNSSELKNLLSNVSLIPGRLLKVTTSKGEVKILARLVSIL